MKNTSLCLILLFTSLITIGFYKEQKSKSTNEIKSIALQPYDEVTQEEINLIQESIQDVYRFKVKILKVKRMPNSAFTNIKSPRYRADKMLDELLKIKPENTDLILGITSTDISFTKYSMPGVVKSPFSKYKDFGIYGLGYRPGKSSIISTFRLGKDMKRRNERLTKIAIHEIGHNLGLQHCKHDHMCIMNDAAETIKTIDRIDNKFCNQCHNIINTRGYNK